MSRRTTILIATLGLLVLLLIVVRALDKRPAAVNDIPEPGSEALSQIYGTPDTTDGTPDEGSSDTAEVVAPTASAIAGQVVLPGREPAVGATVTATSTETTEVVELLTDSGGMFAFEDLPEGSYVIEASLPGYGPAIALGARAGQTQLRLALQSGREISGLVTHGEEPVPYAVVHVGGPGMFPQRSVVADSRGRFVLAGMRPGRYEMLTTGTGVGSGFGGRITIDDAAGESQRLDIPVFRAASNTIRVVDGVTKEPVVTAVVTLAEGPLHVLSLSMTARGGIAEIDYLPRGEYHLRVRSPGYLPFNGVVRMSGSDGDLVVELTSGATVRGRVTDAAGNAVQNAVLTAVITTPEGARWELRETLFDEFHRLVRPDGTPFWLPSVVYRSAPNGYFSLAGLPAGQARIVASRTGLATVASNELTLEHDTVYEPLNLVLPPGRRVRGRVEDGSGGAIAGAFVSVRPPTVPSWASPTGVTTPAVGVFDIGDLAEDVIISVRHPDFAPTELRVTIPPEGLDDLIIRLSGDQLPAVSGRLYTSRGRAAVGALIWLMAGETNLPACQATVGADGWFRATHCSSVPERLIASYAEHAPLIAEMAGDEPRDWTMPVGGEIEVLSRGTPVVASIEPRFALPTAHWARPEITLDSWSREIIEHVAAGSYRVTCRADGFDDGYVDITVVDGQRIEAACPTASRLVEFPIVVVDPQGAPISGAVVFVDRTDPPLRAVTDDRGRVTVRSRPGLWLNGEAMHEHWGHGFTQFYAHYEEQTTPPTIRIDQPIGGDDPDAMVGALREWGVRVAPDGNSMLVDEIDDATPAAGVGLRRFDRLLWARPMSDFRLSIGARRDGELLTFELVREPQ